MTLTVKVLLFCVCVGLCAGVGATILSLDIFHFVLFGTTGSVYWLLFWATVDEVNAWWKKQPAFKGFRYWWDQAFKKKGRGQVETENQRLALREVKNKFLEKFKFPDRFYEKNELQALIKKIFDEIEQETTGLGSD